MNRPLLFRRKILFQSTINHLRVSLFMLLSFVVINSAQATEDDLGCTMTCLGHVNLSLDSDCESTVSYRSLLADPDNPSRCIPNGPSAYKVIVYDVAGNAIGNKVTDAHIGQTLQYEVRHYYSGNYCWGTLTVEDKVGPWTACVPDVTIGCTESTDPSNTGNAVWTDCSDFTVDYFDVVTDTDCPSNISSTIKRTWVATDIFGSSKSCSQNIYIKRSSIVDVVGPVNYDGTGGVDRPALTCGASISPEDLPGSRAFPTIDGKAINPTNATCKLGVSYTDSAPIPTCGSGYKIIRNWLVIDWCGGAEKRFTQFIKVGDEVAPSISCPLTIESGTDSGLCKATVQIPAATVSDNCSSVTVRINTPFGQILNNGGTLNNVPVGTYEITYIATDECGNQSQCKAELVVEDDDAPIAICDQSTVVSLSSESVTYVDAKVFDSGSYDNCAAIDFVVTRGTVFDDRVAFTCDDATGDIIMVRLRVFEVGNPSSFSECMVEVIVQDKNGPKLLTCPPNVTVDCEDVSADLSVYGAPTFADNCGFDVVPNVIRDINSCSVGTITRTWTASDENGSVVCTQVITVKNETPFNGEITFPADVTLTECGSAITDELIGEPILPNVACGQLVVNFTDEKFSGGSDACFKLIRKWKVIDWCQYNPAYDPNKGIWIHYQTIKVIDDNKPVLTVSDAITVASIENNCSSAYVEVPLATATDCNPDVVITNNSPFANSSGANASGNYPFGMTVVTFTANDECGNLVTKNVKITVTDGKKPSPVCLSGLVVEIGQTGEVEIWASDIEASSSDNCTAYSNLDFRVRVHDNSVDNPQPPTGTVVTITCDVFNDSGSPDGAAVPIEFWVGDESGNWDYCLTFIAVQDNMDACEDPLGGGAAAMISGKVQSSKGSTIEKVDLNLKSNNPAYDAFVSGINGSYIFSNLESGMNYDVSAEKDGPYNQGVSTYDVLKIMRHIIGSEPFTSPYQLIAADVNGNGKISTSDVLAIRKLVLSITTDFGDDQKSWNFVPADYQFTDPSNPFADDFQKSISYDALSNAIYDANFIGVKIGDINDSAQSNLDGTQPVGQSADLIVADQSFEYGEEVTMTLDASNLGSVAGMQFVLEYDANLLELTDLPSGGEIALDESHFNLDTPGSIKFSWVGSDAQDMSELMTITLQAKGTGSIAHSVNIKENTPLTAEYYSDNSEINGLGIQFSKAGSSQTDFDVYPNPFKETTSVSFELLENQDVTLSIFDVSGKQIFSMNESLARGEQRLDLSKDLFKGAGVYYVQLQHDGERQTKKLVLAF